MRVGRINRDVINALTRIPEVKAQTRVVAREIQRSAKSQAPRRTGRLRRSIKVDNVLERGAVTFRVGWDRRIAFYGPLIELGTHQSTARPHLEPAAEVIKRRI
jgi:HK97 gp10 family phage protein